MKTYKVTTWGREHDVIVFAARYRDGGLAVCMDEPGEGPFATLTVNLGRLNWGYAYVDTNNCPWAPEFLEKNGLAEFAWKKCASGFCEYPLYKFNMEKLKEGMENG